MYNWWWRNNALKALLRGIWYVLRTYDWAYIILSIIYPRFRFRWDMFMFIYFIFFIYQTCWFVIWQDIYMRFYYIYTFILNNVSIILLKYFNKIIDTLFKILWPFTLIISISIFLKYDFLLCIKKFLNGGFNWTWYTDIEEFLLSLKEIFIKFIYFIFIYLSKYKLFLVLCCCQMYIQLYLKNTIVFLYGYCSIRKQFVLNLYIEYAKFLVLNFIYTEYSRFLYYILYSKYNIIYISIIQKHVKNFIVGHNINKINYYDFHVFYFNI